MDNKQSHNHPTSNINSIVMQTSPAKFFKGVSAHQSNSSDRFESDNWQQTSAKL